MLMTSQEKVKVVIFTPAYNKSSGIKYRVDMMARALSKKHDVEILVDEKESVLRKLYWHFGPSFLSKAWVWERIGKTIAKNIVRLKPGAAILVTDVAASALPFLKTNGVKAILSVEDLTPEWIGMAEASSFYSLFCDHAKVADGVISVSLRLREKLLSMGIRSETVPPGLERIYVNSEEAIERGRAKSPVIHSGQIYFDLEYESFKKAATQLLGSFDLISYSAGKYEKKIKGAIPGIKWYNFKSTEEAVAALKGSAVGLVVRFHAHNPTRLYFHASMLQPIVAIGDNWTNIVSDTGIGTIASPTEASEGVRKILDDYPRYIRSMERFAANNLLEVAYDPLIRMLER